MSRNWRIPPLPSCRRVRASFLPPPPSAPALHTFPSFPSLLHYLFLFMTAYGKGRGEEGRPRRTYSPVQQKREEGGGTMYSIRPKKAAPMYCVALPPPSDHGATVQLAADSLSLCLIPSLSRREADGRGIFRGGIHDAQL